MSYLDRFRPSPIIDAMSSEAVREAQRKLAAERAEAILWWAEQPARIAARLAGGRS